MRHRGRPQYWYCLKWDRRVEGQNTKKYERVIVAACRVGPNYRSTRQSPRAQNFDALQSAFQREYLSIIFYGGIKIEICLLGPNILGSALVTCYGYLAINRCTGSWKDRTVLRRLSHCSTGWKMLDSQEAGTTNVDSGNEHASVCVRVTRWGNIGHVMRAWSELCWGQESRADW